MRTNSEYRSLWQDTTADHKHSQERKTTLSAHSDIIIVGGSVAALTTALVLQQEGKKCIVVSPVNLLDANLETAYLNSTPDVSNTHHIYMSDDAIKLIAKSKREAMDLVEGLVNKYNIDCDFFYQAGYLFAQTNSEAELLKYTNNIARKAGIVSNELAYLPVPIGFKKVARFGLQAQLNPVKYLLGLAAALEHEGGIVLSQCRVTKTTYNDDGVVLNTTSGTLHAPIVIYADDNTRPDGPTLPIFTPGCSNNMAFTLTKEPYPEGIIYDMASPAHSFSTYASDGQKYVVATVYEDNADRPLEDMDTYLAEHFPVDKITHRWTSQYCISADGLPYAGLLQGHKNAYIISGLGSNAIVYGSISAKIICSMIYKKHSGYEGLYAPYRS